MRYPTSLSLLLAASLVLNVALLCYQGGRLLHLRAPSHERVIEERQQSFAQLLPAKARKDLDDRLDAAKPELHRHMNRMKHLRAHIRTLLTQEPIDEAALSNAFAEMRHEHDMTQKIYHDAFVDVAKTLDVDSRKHVTKKLHERHDDGTRDE